MVKKILQWERITSLKDNVIWTLKVKNIEDRYRYSISQQNIRNIRNNKNSSEKKSNSDERKYKEGSIIQFSRMVKKFRIRLSQENSCTYSSSKSGKLNDVKLSRVSFDF